MHINKTKDLVSVRFDSLTEIKNHHRSAKSAKVNHTQDSSDYRTPAITDHSPNWFGVNTQEEWRDTMDNGYTDGVELINRLSKTLNIPPLPSARRRKSREDQGDFLDIHAVYAGNLSRAWERTRRRTKNAPSQITIIHNMSVSGSIMPDEYQWRGATMLAIASALEEAGHSVEIIGVMYNENIFTSNSNRKQVVQFPIKNFHTPINISALATTAVLVGFYRSYMFEAKFATDLKISDGLGTSLRGTPAIIKTNSPTVIDGFEEIQSERQAQDFIDTQLNKFRLDRAA